MTRTTSTRCVLAVLLCVLVAGVAGKRLAGEESVAESHAHDSSGKNFLSIMSWNVEKLDGSSEAKTTYVNDVIIRVAQLHNVDVILLQEAQSCSLLSAARDTAGMACVETVVDEDHEAKMSFTVLGGVILYSNSVFNPAQGTENRAKNTYEWRQWVGSDDPSVVDGDGRSLKAAHSSTCTWNKYRSGKGCTNVYSDMPTTNSIKLFLKTGKWNSALADAFPTGIRPVNVHLFSGVRNRELNDQTRAGRREFQMRALLWLNKIWNYNDNYNYGEQAPVTVYGGDFNTLAKADIRRVLAPASDYSIRPWVASDSVRTHGGGGYLDHVVLSSRPNSVIVRSSTEVYDQVDRRDPTHSDHNPLIVKIYATQRNVKSSGPKIDFDFAKGWGKKPLPATSGPEVNGEEWPSLGGERPSPTTTKSGIDDEEWPSLGGK